MTEQTEQPCVGPFAECYKEAFGGLPPSQQREAVKRLTSRRRNPLTAEQCAEPSPEILACLEAVQKAYLSKKQRSKQASATKREAARVRPENVAEPAPVDAVADGVAASSLAPAAVVAEISAEAEPPAPPAPAPVPQKSAPIPIPKKVVPAPAAVKSPAPQAAAPEPAKKKAAGLAGRFA